MNAIGMTLKFDSLKLSKVWCLSFGSVIIISNPIHWDSENQALFKSLIPNKAWHYATLGCILKYQVCYDGGGD